jgi:hypothetical protein
LVVRQRCLPITDWESLVQIFSKSGNIASWTPSIGSLIQTRQ